MADDMHRETHLWLKFQASITDALHLQDVLVTKEIYEYMTPERVVEYFLQRL